MSEPSRIALVAHASLRCDLKDFENSKYRAPIEVLSEVLVGRWSSRAVAVSCKEGMGVE